MNILMDILIRLLVMLLSVLVFGEQRDVKWKLLLVKVVELDVLLKTVHLILLKNIKSLCVYEK